MFDAVRSILKVSTTLLDNQLVERRELHITTIPQSKQLKKAFESVIFRLIENTEDKPVDRNGYPIVGGVNAYPEPVHVVLFVSPESLGLLSQRLSGTVRSALVISICPGLGMLEWRKTEAIPIYEAEFHSG